MQKAAASLVPEFRDDSMEREKKGAAAHPESDLGGPF
jgi:hypothetical protein